MADAQVVITGAKAASMMLSTTEKQIGRAVEEAFLQEARLMMREALRQVPVQDGFLKASGEVLPPKRQGDRVIVTLGFGGAASEYALYVHNSPYEKNWTVPGTKSHFLSDPVKDGVAQLNKTLVSRVSKILGRAAAEAGSAG